MSHNLVPRAFFTFRDAGKEKALGTRLCVTVRVLTKLLLSTCRLCFVKSDIFWISSERRGRDKLTNQLQRYVTSTKF